ncbi:baseplate J/gp47 family protein [Paenibacillus macerans]|uniref:baseplate J/gp47 family protein n=1 Tax=Paenibacillus macerans TaxID=44252 RepID=UPI003D3151DE
MLDKTGFKRRRFDDLFAEMEDKAREAFGETINTSIRSPLGIILRIFAWFLSLLWGTAEDVYNSGYVGTAEGNNLDRLGPYVGTSRIMEQWASGSITITGTPGYTVAAGFRGATTTGIAFETLTDIVLEGGSGTGIIRALEPGISGNVATNTIVVVVNPNSDVFSITNPAPTTGGREKETDAEFREKWDQSVAGGGAASVDAIRGALLRLEGVRAAAVIENNTIEPDEAGRPPKSFQAYILGGDDQVIAETIFSTKSGGIQPYGDVTKEVVDLGGQTHAVSFSRSEEVPIHVSVDIKRNDRYPADGDDQVRSALILYIGGEYGGSYFNGLSMGAAVVYTRLISAVYSVPGVEDLTLTVGPEGNLAPSNVVIQPFQVAQTRAEDIEVISHV